MVSWNSLLGCSCAERSTMTLHVTLSTMTLQWKLVVIKSYLLHCEVQTDMNDFTFEPSSICSVVVCCLDLTSHSLCLQSQLCSRKQMFESVELASQSEIQHLTSKLERANDTICANELEIERLNMKVDDLNDVNRKILEEQQRLQDELRLSQNSLEVSV